MQVQVLRRVLRLLHLLLILLLLLRLQNSQPFTGVLAVSRPKRPQFLEYLLRIDKYLKIKYLQIMDFSFKNMLNNADYKPQKPGQVAISNMLSLFEGLTNLGGLKMPSTSEGYNVDKEVAIRNQRAQISSQITALAAEQMVRVMASMLQPSPVDGPNPMSNPF